MSSAGSEIAFGAIAVQLRKASRAGAIRPRSVISATMAMTTTTTSERRLPRPSSTSAREAQAFASTMP